MWEISFNSCVIFHSMNTSQIISHSPTVGNCFFFFIIYKQSKKHLSTVSLWKISLYACFCKWNGLGHSSQHLQLYHILSIALQRGRLVYNVTRRVGEFLSPVSQQKQFCWCFQFCQSYLSKDINATFLFVFISLHSGWICFFSRIFVFACLCACVWSLSSIGRLLLNSW